MKKSFIAIFSAATMAVSGLGSTIAYAASVFADINNVPWPGAATYIEEAYNLGLMAGYVENGKRYSKPKNNVTYCESVQLMYSIMSKHTGTSVSASVVNKWKNLMASKNIPSWAYNAVAYALENSILSQNDISIFMSSSQKQNNARREDVAVIFGKALAKTYGISQNATLNYKDKKDVAKTSIPYIDLLNRLGIMIGDANNNFNPKENINRSEMSVIVSKTYNKLKSGDSCGDATVAPPSTGLIQYSGQVTAMTSSGSEYSITLKTDGSSKTFTTNSSTSVIDIDGSSTNVSKISTGDNIVAVCNGSIANSIIIISKGSVETDKIVKGTINSISEDKIYIKSSSNSKSYYISKNVEVKIDGRTDKISSLVNKFKGGRNYEVELSLDSNEEVIKIDAKEESGNEKHDKDAIESISSSKITLVSGKKIYLPDDVDDIEVEIDGRRKDFNDLEDAFDDLEKYEQMIVKDYDLDRDDELEQIEVEIKELKDNEKKKSVSGVVESISESYVRVNGEKYSFPDDEDDVDMEFDGHSYRRLDDFVDDVDNERDEVYAEIELRGNEISEIVVTICDDVVKGEISSVDSSSVKIDRKSYDVKSKSISISVTAGNGKIDSLSDLESAVEDDNMTIDVSAVVYDDEIIAITGNVTEIPRAAVKSFSYSSKDTSCYLNLNVDSLSSSVKLYFDDDPDISINSRDYDDDLRGLRDYIDDERSCDVTIRLDKYGKITDLEVE